MNNEMESDYRDYAGFPFGALAGSQLFTSVLLLDRLPTRKVLSCFLVMSIIMQIKEDLQ